MINLKELGVALKAYRVAAGESVEELAEATEMETATIKKIEAGLHKPTHSDVNVLAQHFSIRGQEAKRLYKLAGHSSETIPELWDDSNIDLSKIKEDVEILFAPIFFTDMVNVVTNKYGVTINFMQNANGGQKPIIVSRVGMSFEHTESIIEVLQESLRRAKNEQNEADLPETDQQT